MKLSMQLLLLLLACANTSQSQNCLCPAGATEIVTGGAISINAGDYCVSSGSSAVLTGGITLNGGVNICVQEGAVLELSGSLLFNGTENHITVNDEAVMIVEGSINLSSNVNSINLNDCSFLEVCGTTTLNNIAGFPWSNEINYIGDGVSTNTTGCPAYSIHRGALSGGENGSIPAVDPAINLINMASNAFHLNGNSQSDCGPNTANTNVPPPSCVAAGTWPMGLSNSTSMCRESVMILAILPVDLVSFYAKVNTRSVTLMWETVTEISNDFFNIQRSMDGINWNNITRVDGAGVSTEPIKYKFIDFSPSQGANYYRLKQTDYDGAFAYSDIVVVRFDKKLSFSSQLLFPNPADNDFKINVLGNESDEALLLRIYDMNGILHKTVNYVSNTAIDIKELESGLYMVVLTNGSGDQSIQKLMKR